jgi:hypothetical protein
MHYPMMSDALKNILPRALQDDAPPPDITIPPHMNRDSVIQFVFACQNKLAKLTQENVNNCFILSVEWGVPALTADIAAFLSVPENLQISLIRFLLGIHTMLKVPRGQF